MTTTFTKHRLCMSLAVPVLLCRCEMWTLLVDTENRIQPSKTKCLRRLLWITCMEAKPLKATRKNPLPTTVKQHKLVCFCHAPWHNTQSKNFPLAYLELTPRWEEKELANVIKWNDRSLQNYVTILDSCYPWQPVPADHHNYLSTVFVNEWMMEDIPSGPEYWSGWFAQCYMESLKIFIASGPEYWSDWSAQWYMESLKGGCRSKKIKFKHTAWSTNREHLSSW